MTVFHKANRSIFFHAINIANPKNFPRLARQDFWGAIVLSGGAPVLAKLIQALFLN